VLNADETLASLRLSRVNTATLDRALKPSSKVFLAGTLERAG